MFDDERRDSNLHVVCLFFSRWNCISWIDNFIIVYSDVVRHFFFRLLSFVVENWEVLNIGLGTVWSGDWDLCLCFGNLALCGSSGHTAWPPKTRHNQVLLWLSIGARQPCCGGAVEWWIRWTKERGSNGTREQRSRRARENGSRGAGEEVSRGAR